MTVPKRMREDLSLRINDVYFMKLKPLLCKISNKTPSFRVLQHP